MKKAFFIGFTLLLGLFMTSCTQVFFDQPQPVNGKKLRAFPKEIQGLWIDADSEQLVKIEARTVTGFYQKEDSLIVEEFFTLSDTAVLKKAGNLWTLNLKSEEGWEIIVIERMSDQEIRGYLAFMDEAEIAETPNISLEKYVKEGEGEKYFLKAELRSNQIPLLIDTVKFSPIILQVPPDSLRWIGDGSERRRE